MKKQENNYMLLGVCSGLIIGTIGRGVAEFLGAESFGKIFLVIAMILGMVIGMSIKKR